MFPGIFGAGAVFKPGVWRVWLWLDVLVAEGVLGCGSLVLAVGSKFYISS